MREEYTRDNYPTFGKKYAGERAIISLTSWKARIDTVSKTLYSLLKQCPGFHIVLVLSEEEFPKMMDEMPSNLKLFVKNDLIEVLWVYKNYKAFKKVLFTMDKYRDVPVISADDDCYYKCNYAQELYDNWMNSKNVAFSFYGKTKYKNTIILSSQFSIFPPFCFSDFGRNLIVDRIVELGEDDIYYAILRNTLSIKVNVIKKNIYKIVSFHDELSPLKAEYKKRKKNSTITEYEKLISSNSSK
jgi:hypothetical protein